MWNKGKEFGFIALDSGGASAFLGRKALERSGINALAAGQRVEVDVADTTRGPAAVTIRLL